MAENNKKRQFFIGIAKGKDGKSAYEIAVDEGFEGTKEEWLESLKDEDEMTVKFGRIIPSTTLGNGIIYLTPGSFEIFINEDTNMTVNLYSGDTTPAKTFSSDVFIFLTGNHGDDKEDGNVYQKTLILYTKTTLGVPSLNKWIACSDSSVYDNVKIEVICPPNTYHGIIKNQIQ